MKTEYKLLIAFVIFIMMLVMALIIMVIVQKMMAEQEIQTRQRTDLSESVTQKIAIVEAVGSSRETGKMNECFLEGQNRYKQTVKTMCLSENKEGDCGYDNLGIDNLRKLGVILEEIITKDVECQSNYSGSN